MTAAPLLLTPSRAQAPPVSSPAATKEVLSSTSSDLTSTFSSTATNKASTMDPSPAPHANTVPPSHLIPQVIAYVKTYMAQYDGSHDFSHIQRVLGLAHILRLQEPSAYAIDIVTLAALLHDVGDKKYLQPGQDGKIMVSTVLLSMGADGLLAERIQSIVNCVSYSAEVAPGGAAKIEACVSTWGREVEVVQDADRLDAIGAVGVGRCFAFGGMKGRGLQDSIDHFEDKLERLPGMMKTQLGKKMANERVAVVTEMRRAWERENAEAMVGLEGLEGLDLGLEKE